MGAMRTSLFLRWEFGEVAPVTFVLTTRVIVMISWAKLEKSLRLNAHSIMGLRSFPCPDGQLKMQGAGEGAESSEL